MGIIETGIKIAVAGVVGYMIYDAGFDACYEKHCHQDYKVVVEDGSIYVEDKRTGNRSLTDSEFMPVEKEVKPVATIDKKVAEALNKLNEVK